MQAPEVLELGPRWRDESGNGVLWTLEESTDLNVNLVRLEARAEIGEHLNAEVDVVMSVLEGSGEVVVDDVAYPLERTTLAFVPRGARRAVRAGERPLVYLSTHRRREGLRVRAAGGH